MGWTQATRDPLHTIRAHHRPRPLLLGRTQLTRCSQLNWRTRGNASLRAPTRAPRMPAMLPPTARMLPTRAHASAPSLPPRACHFVPANTQTSVSWQALRARKGQKWAEYEAWGRPHTFTAALGVPRRHPKWGRRNETANNRQNRSMAASEQHLMLHSTAAATDPVQIHPTPAHRMSAGATATAPGTFG